MTRRVYLAEIIGVLLMAWSCGGGPKHTDLTPPPSRDVVESAPSWYRDPPADADYLLGVSTATSRDMQLAVNKAQAEGRNQIAQQLDVRFGTLAKRFQEEVGIGDDSELLDEFTQVYKAVTSEVLTGSRMRDQQIQTEGDIYRVYALMEMPIGAANQALLAKIRTREHLYTRFRASQAFKELEDEITRYEEWKRHQEDRE